MRKAKTLRHGRFEYPMGIVTLHKIPRKKK
jgi:hypothetical protein